MHRNFLSTLVPTACAALALILIPHAARADFLISDFNGVGPDFTYGDFSGTIGATAFDLSSPASNGGIGWFYGTPLDLSAFSAGHFALTALTLPRNQASLQLIIQTANGGPTDNYGYYYVIPVSEFNASSFATGISGALNSPDFVLDSANGYSLVGSGPSVAPNLAKVLTFQVQGTPFAVTPLEYRLDNLALVLPAAVPEPGSIALLVGMGLSGAGFLARRKRARK